MEKRAMTSISNIKLPHVGEKEKKFRPIKQLNWYINKPHQEREFKESASLYFSPEARRKAQKTINTNNEDLDLTMKNMRAHLEAKRKQQSSISPEIGHHIDKFENLNDLEKAPDFGDQSGEENNKKRRRRRKKQQKDSIMTQFGFTSSGLPE